MTAAVVSSSSCAATSSPDRPPALARQAVTNEAAVDVAFAGPSTGWLAVAAAPTSGSGTTTTEVMGTHDGGAGWTEQWSGPGQPEELVAPSPGHAFLVLGSGVMCPGLHAARCQARQLATRLLATSDGGHEWATVWSSGAQLSQTTWATGTVGLGSLVSSTCLDQLPPGGDSMPQCAGSVVRTTDAGRRWGSVLRTSGPVVALATSPGTWFALQIVTSTARGKDAVQTSHLLVWASTDQGQKWAARGIVNLTADALGPSASATVIAGPGDEMWLSLVDPASCAMHGCSTVATWHSADAGRHWALTPSPLGSLPQPRPECGPHAELPMAAGPGGAIYISTGVNLAACAPPDSVLARWDGRTWQLVRTWDLAELTAISWPSAAYGYVIVGGVLARTADAGRSWSQSWPASAPAGPLTALSATLALAGGDASDPGVVLRTDNGGVTWSALAELPGEVTAIDFPTVDNGFLVLLNPVADTWQLEVSADGGRHWRPRGRLPAPRVPGLEVEGVSGLWAASSSAALVLTTNGAGVYDLSGVAPAELWSTSDGGRDWAHISTVPGGTPWSLDAAGFSFSEAGNWWGLVQGTSTRTATELTAEGGRSWASRTEFPGFGGLQVLSPEVITGRGNNPDGSWYMMVTTDGGAHWARHPLPGPAHQGTLGVSYSLAFADAADGWWSDGGYVWTTSDGGARWDMATAP